MPGQAFELGPSGIVPLGQGVLGATDGMIAGGAMLAAIASQRVETTAPEPVAAISRALASVEKLHAKFNVVLAAKARIRELKAELRRHKALQRELAELQRLVAAAKSKPRASIRALDSARRAG